MIAGCETGCVIHDRGVVAATAAEPGPDEGWYLRTKMVLDMALAAILFVLSLPAMLLAMAVVKLTSRGPAIYSQIRVGLGGRTFLIYKIRTMTHDCERLTGPQWSVGNDPRVTPVGRVLRRLHLDELPQLWNVMRGDMSLVGPRPERPVFVTELERVIPGYRDRLAVRPGITGLAQIQLPPDEDVRSVRRKVARDLTYIRSAGPWLDLRILVGTALKVIHVPRALIGRLLWLPTGEESRPAPPPPEPTMTLLGADPVAW